MRLIKGRTTNKFIKSDVRVKKRGFKGQLFLRKLYTEPKVLPNNGFIQKEEEPVTDEYMGRFKAYLGRYSAKTRELYLSWYRRFTKHYGSPNNIYSDTMQSYMNELPKVNPFYKGAVGAYIRCFNKAGVFPEIVEKPEIRRRVDPGKKRVKYLTHEQIIKLIKLSPPYLSIVIQLYFETGGRLREIINATREQIDLNNRCINSVKRKSMTEYIPEIHGSRGKNDKDFKLVFSEGMAHRLVEYLSENRNKFPFRVPNVKSKDPGRSFMYRLKRVARYLKIHDNLHPHMLRHSLGHFMTVDLDMKIQETQQKLRHASINSTAIYTELTQEEVDDKLDKIAFSHDAKKKVLAEIERKKKEEHDKKYDIISLTS